MKLTGSVTAPPGVPGRTLDPAALVVAESALHRRSRTLWNVGYIGVCVASAAIVLLPLTLILWHLLAKGLPGLTLDFFLNMPKPVGEVGGGMANAIAGTLILVSLGAVLAVPAGVAAGVYLAEFGNDRFGGAIR